jgi:hypothetical protein
MFTARRIHRPAILCALACALLLPATSGAAAGQPSQGRHAAALAQERYYSSYAEPQPLDAATSAALAQERQYSSYGEPKPLAPSQSPAPSDNAPWLAIALAIAAALTIAAASATQLRRLGIRRRRAARVPR